MGTFDGLAPTEEQGMDGSTQDPTNVDISASSQSIASNQKEANDVYRVTGIPIDYKQKQVKTLLQTVLQLDRAGNSVKLRSIAISPNRRTKVATVCFSCRPIRLPKRPNKEWHFPIPIENNSENSNTNDDDDNDTITQEQIVTVDSHFKGITVLRSFRKLDDHKIDIIAISGLGGHAFGSFKARGRQHMWLCDSLPSDLPGAQIMIYGYDTQLYGSTSFQDLESLASSLRVSIAAQRTLGSINTKPRTEPLIFIAHSLGGLIVKEAIIQMKSDNKHQDLLESIYGGLFFGVPSQGMEIASLIPMVAGQPNQALLYTLGKESQLLRNQSRDFPKTFDSKDSEIFCYYETEMSRTAKLAENNVWEMEGPLCILVDSSSARHTRPWENEAHNCIGMKRDHSELVKFSPNDSDYNEVLAKLNRMMLTAVSITPRGNRGLLKLKQLTKDEKKPIKDLQVTLENAKELITALPTTAPEHVLQATQRTSLVTPDYLATAQGQSLETNTSSDASKNFPRYSNGFYQETFAIIWLYFGLGGVGKTQIALEFACCTREANPAYSIFWVPATDHVAFEQAYKKIGQELNIPGIDAKGANIKQLVKDALSDKRIGPWLMIVDNADDINIVFRQPTNVEATAPALIDYIPTSPNGSTLITTRNRRVAVRQAAKNIILLEIMSQEDAKKLLEQSLLRQELLLEVNATNNLLDILGLLPLAIVHAAAYINENDTTIDEYTSLYSESETEVMEVLSEDFEVHGRYKTMKSSSIATTWLISLNQLARTNPTAIDYLSFMACLFNFNICQSLLLPASSKKQGLEAIGTLKAYSFIRKREDGPTFDIHPLVHLASRDWLRKQGKLQMWSSRATLQLVELLQDSGHENRTTWTLYLPHAKFLLTSAIVIEGDLQVVLLAERLGRCFYSNGEYSEAYEVYKRALDLRLKASGQENRDTLTSRFGMAEALNHQGKYKQAECQHREILELRRKVLGPKDPEVGRSLNYLAQALYDGGKYVEAEKAHRDALTLQNEVLHSEHPNVLTTTGYLAQTLSQQGKYKEAYDMHKTLLKVRLRVAGEQYPGTLATMSCLGVAQGDLGSYEEAEQTHRQVLQLRIKVLGERHPHTSITKRWLADALLHQAKYEEALCLNQEALELQLRLLGGEHPNTILVLRNLGDIFYFQGQNDRAEEIYREVLDRHVKVLGPEHPQTLESMNSWANTLYNQAKHTKADEMYAKAFQGRIKVLGPQHPKTLATPH